MYGVGHVAIRSRATGAPVPHVAIGGVRVEQQLVVRGREGRAGRRSVGSSETAGVGARVRPSVEAAAVSSMPGRGSRSIRPVTSCVSRSHLDIGEDRPVAIGRHPAPVDQHRAARRREWRQNLVAGVPPEAQVVEQHLVARVVAASEPEASVAKRWSLVIGDQLAACRSAQPASNRATSSRFSPARSSCQKPAVVPIPAQRGQQHSPTTAPTTGSPRRSSYDGLMVKILVLVLLAGILVSLFSGLFFSTGTRVTPGAC